MKNTISDPNVGGKLDGGDKATITSAIEEAIKWLESNQAASKEEYEGRQKELEGTCGPIISKMYQQDGGEGGGGMPGVFPGAGAGHGGGAPPRPPANSGPKFEEVD